MENPITNRCAKSLASVPIASLPKFQPERAESKYLSFLALLRKAKRAIICLGAVGLALLSLTGCVQEAVVEQPLKPAPAVSPYEIQLRSRKFTPKPGVPADLAARIDRVIAQAAPEKKRAHILVQLRTPPEPADRKRFAKQGLALLEPLNKRVWYAAVTSRSIRALPRLKGVRWADLIKPDDKLSEKLRKDLPPLPYNLRPGGRIAYSVLFHKDVIAREVTAFAKSVEGKLEVFDAKSFPVVRSVIISVPRGRLVALAEADIVSWIEPSPPPDEDQNLLNAQPLSNVDDVQGVPFDLDGTGVTVGLWEAGDVVQAALLDLTPRLIVQAGQTAGSDDHAAHVAGTIGASGANVVNAEGMAPNVTIASWDSANDAAEMTNAATSAGNPGDPTPIQISSHSYGPGIGWNAAGTVFTNNQNLFGQYNNQAQGFDDVVFQTGLIVVKSAGNDRDDAWNGFTPIPGVPPAPVPARDGTQGGFGVDADCIGPRGTAKNIITVGAMNGAGAIAVFSNFGPTDDGRIKPDLVAQGVGMLSLACNCFDDRNGDGIDDVPNTLTSSRIMGGTSMSTPVVSGVAALVLQEANTLNIDMTPAAMKALLIQTAQDVQGVGQSTVGPDYATGWGIVDAEAAVNLLRQSGLAQGTLNAIGAAAAWTQTFYVPAGEAEIHLTLVWDDPAGNPGGQILINDLDLRLIAPDATQFTPWTLNPANPGAAAVRNGGNDAVNNVEQVSVQNPMAGIWTVQVSSDAGNLPDAPLDFAVAGLLARSDVMLVMDRSGSMSLGSGTPGLTKLEALQNAANEFVDLLDLGGGHRLGLVQFEENLVPFVPAFDLQQLAAANVGAAHTAIGSMDTGGWTNIIAGVNEAANQLGTIASPASPFPRQTIVVFSDGKHNRPVGSDLNNINATVQAGNYKFYSIGFGTDVDDAILTNVANNSGGIHVNEQDLSAIQLTKYFLTVGALVHDMTVLSDPTYQLGPGESAKFSVNLSKLDHSVTFAVNWTGEHANDIKLSLQAPDRRCRIPLKDHKGLQIRKGKTYRLIRVELPYNCNGIKVHEGKWTIQAGPDDMSGDAKETVDIMILGDSRLKLRAKAGLGQDKGQLLLAARFLQDGSPLRRLKEAYVKAHILLPQPDTYDSEKQDRFKKSDRPEKQEPSRRERRWKTLQLYDNGKNGDRKAGDGVFTTALDISGLKPGLLQTRLVATFQDGKLELTREATACFYVRR